MENKQTIIARFKEKLWNEEHAIYDLDGVVIDEFLMDFANEIEKLTALSDSDKSNDRLCNILADCIGDDGAIDYQLERIKEKIEHQSSVLYDTLGSAKTGDALDALPRIAESLEDIANNLNMIIGNGFTSDYALRITEV